MNLKIGSRIYDEQTKSFGKVSSINKDSFIVEWADCKTKHPVTTILKEASKDCPDCPGTFVGKENETCPTCGRFSVKEALKTALPSTIPNQRGYLDNPQPVKASSDRTVYCDVCGEPLTDNPEDHKHLDVYAKTNKDAAKHCAICGTEYNTFQEYQQHQKEKHAHPKPAVCPECGKHCETVSEVGRHREIEHKVTASVEKKAEVIDAEELDLYANNTSELYGDKLEIIDTIKKMLKNNTYDRRTMLSMWEDWFGKAAQRYAKEFSGSNISPEAIMQAAREIEPYELERVKSGEYASEVEQDISKLPVMDVEQAKDDLLNQLAKETDPERKKSLEQKYKRLSMASLNVTAHIRHEDGKWVIYSHDYKKKLGTYDTKESATKRLREIEYFKSHKGSVRPFSKKTAAEVMVDPYASLTNHITEMRQRMSDVQTRLETTPLPKQAGVDEEDSSELSTEEVFSDIAMGLDLLEVKLKDEPESEELHNSLEELENLLWETEQKAGITPKLSEEEREEPEHKDIVEEVEKESSEKGGKPSSLVHKENKDELTREELEDESVEKEASSTLCKNCKHTKTSHWDDKIAKNMKKK